MDKTSPAKKPKYIFLAIIFLALVLASIIAVAAICINSASSDAYGSYIDNDANKIINRTLEIDGRTVSLQYLRTENLRTKPASKRADVYGTYDVYSDDECTEYMFLLNTDVFCGFKYENVGVATEREKAISQEEALAIAGNYLRENRQNFENYTLKSCKYGERAGYYDVQYCLQVCGYPSDDIFRLWIDAQGRITSFSEYNYKRYDGLTISQEKYATAEKKIDKKIAALEKKARVTIVDSYVSIDDSGKTVLTKVIDLSSLGNGTSTPSRELLVQRIG